MDEHGATKFPADRIEQVLQLCSKLQAKEDEQLAKVRKCQNAEEIRALLEGHAYGSRKKQRLESQSEK